jgi:hypothetical protein
MYLFVKVSTYFNVIHLIDVLFDLVSNDGQFTYPLGMQQSTKWTAGNVTIAPTVSYTYEQKKVIVELICSTNGTSLFEVFDESPINTFKFRLTDKCACWNGCQGKEIRNELVYITLRHRFL